MPLAATQGFVLGCSPHNEQDRLVYLFTLEKGIIRAAAPGSMKARNRFGSLFELFTEGEFHYYWQENREMITISNGEIIASYFSTVSDPKNIFYFYLVADVLLQFVPFNHQDKRLYRLLHSLLTHSIKGIEIRLLLLYFLIWILRIEGMMFDPGFCSSCNARGIDQGWLRLDFRGILCRQCKTTESIIFHEPELLFIRWTERNSPGELEKWKEALDIPKLIRAFTRQIEYHGECTLKSALYLPEFS